MKTKAEALEEIRENISKHGHHVYVVLGGPNPRFGYTIGLSETFGFELILAGAAYYSVKEVHAIIEGIAQRIRRNEDWRQIEYKFGSKGVFSLGEVDSSWSRELMLGAFDYYKKSKIEALQIRLDADHWTIDVPNLRTEWDPVSDPVWQWLKNPWKYSIPERSMGITNLDALNGKPITEATRWEENEWELFAGAGPDVDKADVRIVPLERILHFNGEESEA